MDKANSQGSRFVGVIALIYGLFLLYGIGANAMDRVKVGMLTQHMKTACIGRFLINLPVAMDYSYSHTFMHGFWIAAIPESEEAFLQRVSAREAEINSAPNELGNKNMEKVLSVSNHGFSGKIFTFGRTSVKGGLENGKRVYYVNVAQEGYAHAHGTTFTFKTDAIDPDRTDVLGTMIDKLRLVAPNHIPLEPGFCFGRGMFIDPVPVEWTEGVAMFAGFREHPDLAMVFRTRAGLGKNPYDPGRLARNARADEELTLSQRARIQKLRIGHRVINGIDGEEVVEKGIESNFVTVFLFDWEVFGTKDNAFAPEMHLEMSTGHPVHAGSAPVTSFLTEDALLHLWDKISSSIRVRPAGQAAPANRDTSPAGPKLGDSATAGDKCPETGWWQCADSGKGTGVLGGQRQFLRKGERMPQAILLPSQTLWEKLRGLQRSYASSEPTAWTLMDRRSKVRVQPGFTLAPAVTQSGMAAIPTAGISAEPAGNGAFATTGASCPASGWWQCQDSDALDGTRWFAQGALLPAATFKLAQRIPMSRVTALFQRRSSWKLVRSATASDEHNA